MGKRQHQKDKLYLTCTEWSTIYGGRRPGQDQEDEAAAQYRRLPYDHCALSLQPFEHPYCTPDGTIYDLANIVPFLQKFGIDPVSGQPLDSKTLIKLDFQKNNDGFYHCPVLYKVFSEHTHIVAIKTTGNVFCYEAVEQLNLKAKNFKDLLTDEPFTKKDIITLQDPNSVDKFNVANFHHVKNQMRWNVEDEEREKDPNYKIRNINHETRATLAELSKTYEASTSAEKKETPAAAKPDIFNAAHYSTGRVAAAFTSTVMDQNVKMEAATLDDDVVRYARIKKKGYLQLQTNMGPLNVELFCDQTPKTCDNFIRLCKKGYYDGTIFHRSIKNFMIQGGDPTGRGTGGESAFGKPFEDEFRPQFVHQGRGMLSMANSGPNSNKSQFFITYRSCRHLDKKHTVFGRLVGGLETLDKIERIKTTDKDRPLEDIKILKTVAYIDPYQEVDDEIANEREKMRLEREKSAAETRVKPQLALKPIREGVGAFINLNPIKGNASREESESMPAPKKKKLVSGTFGNFSNW